MAKVYECRLCGQLAGLSHRLGCDHERFPGGPVRAEQCTQREVLEEDQAGSIPPPLPRVTLSGAQFDPERGVLWQDVPELGQRIEMKVPSGLLARVSVAPKALPPTLDTSRPNVELMMEALMLLLESQPGTTRLVMELRGRLTTLAADRTAGQ